MKNMFNMKKSAATKTAVQMTASQKKTTTVANISGKVKTTAFGVATGAGIAGTMMMQNERGIRNRKAREAYHKRVEQVCTVAVGAAVVGATAAVVQGIFDPVIDVSMLEIEPASYLELNNKAVDPAPVAPADPAPVAPAAEQPAPAAPAPADSAAAAQTNKGSNAQDAKSKTGKQQPKDNGQGASNNNGQNGNNHAKAAK